MKAIHEEHLLLRRRYAFIKTVLQSNAAQSVKIVHCDAALEELRAHMDGEDRLMDAIHYPADKAKRHKDHHAMILRFFESEIRMMRIGASDGMAAIEMGDEWFPTHLSMFDCRLFHFYLNQQRPTTRDARASSSQSVPKMTIGQAAAAAPIVTAG